MAFYASRNAKSAADFRKSNDTLKVWAEGEGEDLGDVLGKLSILLDHYVSAQTRFGSHLSTLRLHFKSIRTREEAFSDLKNRKRALGNRIESVEKKLAKMGPENKELMKTTASLKELRAEMESMRQEVTVEEAAIGDYKRRTAKEALGLKCGGLLEFAEKVTVSVAGAIFDLCACAKQMGYVGVSASHGRSALPGGRRKGSLLTPCGI